MMASGLGATATIWTPDLLQTLAQGRQVTIFTNKCLGLSVDSREAQADSIEGDSCKSCSLHMLHQSMHRRDWVEQGMLYKCL